MQPPLLVHIRRKIHHQFTLDVYWNVQQNHSCRHTSAGDRNYLSPENGR